MNDDEEMTELQPTETRKKDDWRQKAIRPERVLAGGFFVLILVGGLLLSLPLASTTGQSIGLFNGLFTATSAVCVTGLVVVDTGTAFSLFGQVVLMLLIQMGGLGFMIFATLVMLALGRRISLRNRMMIRESMNAATLSGMVRLSLWYGGLALCIELLGAALLGIRFIPMYGWGKGLYYSVFHAVSAFCNAGFDLLGNYSSLTAFSGDPLVVLTIAGLIILGGLGFSVLFECVHYGWQLHRLSLHAKMVLVMTIALVLTGTLFFLVLEWSNPATLGAEGVGVGEKLLGAFFQSVTMRTAGFNTIDLAGMREASKLFAVILMFVGASPASTGGGVKTTTIGALLLMVRSVLQGDSEVNVMHKRLPGELIRRSLVVLVISLGIVLGGTMVLTVAERESRDFLDLLFEGMSAFATVGVSSAGTPGLSMTSKVVLIPMMFFGRVGPLTIALALANKQGASKSHLKYPEEKIMIG